MRTTVTIDDDVGGLLRQAMQQTGQSFKATLNQAIRRGLVDMEAPTDEAPFTVTARPMDVRAGIDQARFNQQSDELEIDAFINVTGRLEQGRRPRNTSSDR